MLASVVGRPTRRFSGRQGWFSAIPAAAELQFRQAVTESDRTRKETSNSGHPADLHHHRE